VSEEKTMSEQSSNGIGQLIRDLLKERGIESVREDEALFSSGLLDSMAATEVLMALESEYGVDLADEDFDILQIDTLKSLGAFVALRKVA
jgi:acyl carrier protein